MIRVRRRRATAAPLTRWQKFKAKIKRVYARADLVGFFLAVALCGVAYYHSTIGHRDINWVGRWALLYANCLTLDLIFAFGFLKDRRYEDSPYRTTNVIVWASAVYTHLCLWKICHGFVQGAWVDRYGLPIYLFLCIPLLTRQLVYTDPVIVTPIWRAWPTKQLKAANGLTAKFLEDRVVKDEDDLDFSPHPINAPIKAGPKTSGFECELTACAKPSFARFEDFYALVKGVNGDHEKAWAKIDQFLIAAVRRRLQEMVIDLEPKDITRQTLQKINRRLNKRFAGKLGVGDTKLEKKFGVIIVEINISVTLSEETQKMLTTEGLTGRFHKNQAGEVQMEYDEALTRAQIQTGLIKKTQTDHKVSLEGVSVTELIGQLTKLLKKFTGGGK